MHNSRRILCTVLIVFLSLVQSVPLNSDPKVTVFPRDSLVQRDGNNYIIRESKSKSSPTETQQFLSSITKQDSRANDFFLGEMVPGSAFALG